MYCPHSITIRRTALAAMTLAALLAASCDKVFDIHPYDVRITGPHDLNRTNMERIAATLADKDTVRVAFISDTHCWYDDLKDEVAHINRRGDIDLVVHCGDQTNIGSTMEYLWSRDRLLELEPPMVALLGNHDCLGTGMEAFGHLYGNPDFSLVVGGVKLLCLNTNAGEYDRIVPVPNLPYMDAESEAGDASRTLVVMHIPPQSDQFNTNVDRAFRFYLGLQPGLMCCVFGHDHDTVVWEPYDDGLRFYGVASAEKRTYRVFTITPDGYEQELVAF